MGGIEWVFGYGSLVDLTAPLVLEGHVHSPMPGRLRGFRRRWGAAMNNWEAGEEEKHFLDVPSGLKPRVTVAYLDLVESPGDTANGLAIPVDETRLAELDAREINYVRVEVSGAFQPAVPQRVFVYLGTEAARRRCLGAEAEICVSRQYVTRIRRGFTALGEGQLEEFERTTEPLPFPERDLEPHYPPLRGGDGG